MIKKIELTVINGEETATVEIPTKSLGVMPVDVHVARDHDGLDASYAGTVAAEVFSYQGVGPNPRPHRRSLIDRPFRSLTACTYYAIEVAGKVYPVHDSFSELGSTERCFHMVLSRLLASDLLESALDAAAPART